MIGLHIRSIRLPTALEVRCLRRGLDGGRGKGKKSYLKIAKAEKREGDREDKKVSKEVVRFIYYR